MATVALQYAGQAVGTFFGGPLGGVLGRAAGAVAGSFVDNALLGSKTRRVHGSRLSDLRVMTSTEGASIPRVWGRMRVAGQVIWATHFEEAVSTRTEKASSKGAGGAPKTKVTDYLYFANFAVALAEGPVTRIGRAWADGKPIDLAEFTTRFYAGSETQMPDSLVVAKEGEEAAPAYRGLSYIVFERMPLAKFGNRLPQLSFEVYGRQGGSEALIRAVDIIPGSTEFGYDTMAVNRKLGEGETAAENTHASAIRSDWDVSIDALTAACGNLRSAALVVAWFGDDLRCSHCRLRPGVEVAEKTTRPYAWRVAGQTRASAHVVSTVDGHPAFGGTPSDASVVRALQDLRARGLRTVFYPFILMDIAATNDLPDPYTGAIGQPAYPWRGRITCAPAPGVAGSPDKTAAAAAQAAAFIGTASPSDFVVSGDEVVYSGPAEWSLRRMVLHYARLCQLAGGVDAFIISSELRGLTTLRDGPSSYPVVAALAALAADVASILPDARISYAADWSEYFGHQPQDGTNDVHFHLDPLWASPDIGFVGIDNYMPLSDWRDGAVHLDAATSPSVYDRDYLKSNIAGGEGFDWFYASAGHRAAQTRTPITDGAYGKPWVFRYKDLRGWWENEHFDRPGGIEAAAPTAWLPRSKPIWFTEAGCPAVDKGSNQPNVFIDPKSSESAAPYFSSGARDDFMLHAYARALSGYWSAPGPHNPASPVYGGPMLAADDVFFWAWDARPFPDFPGRDDVWADGANHARGHWLNGRIESVPFDALVEQICSSHGFTDVETEGLEGLVDGALAERVMSARELIEPLALAFAFDAVESGGKIKFVSRRKEPAAALDREALVEIRPDAPLHALTRAQETELPAALKLTYAESGLDYRLSAVEARHAGGGSLRETGVELPCAIGQAMAQKRADILLRETWAGRETMTLALPPSLMRLEPGDVTTLGLGARIHVLRLEEVSDGAHRTVTAKAHDAAVYVAPDAPERSGVLPRVAIAGPPAVELLDLPLAGEGIAAHAPWIAAAASPWPGRLGVLRREGGAGFGRDRVIEAPAVMGELVDALPRGPLGLYDRAARVRVRLYSGALAAVSALELLDGANAAAVRGPSGWEILQFRDCVLVGPRTYEVSWLLRGQSGSEPEMAASAPPGSRFVLLDALTVQTGLPAAKIGQDITWRVGPEGRDHGDPAFVEIVHRANGIGLRPPSPAHLRARREGGDIVFTWLRRTRIDGDSWELPDVPLAEEREAYEIDVMAGAAVLRRAGVNESSWRYTAAQQSADFAGSPPASFTIRVAQLSTAYGRGSVLERIIHV